MTPPHSPPDKLCAFLRRFDPISPPTAQDMAALASRIFAHIDADEARSFRPFSPLATPFWMTSTGSRSWLSVAGSLVAICVLSLGFFVFANATDAQTAFYADPFETHLLAFNDTSLPLSIEQTSTLGESYDPE